MFAKALALKTIILVLILCAAMASSRAASYDQWVLSDTNVTMGKYFIIPSIEPGWDTASFTLPGDLFLLGVGECRATLTYRICFLGTRWDITQKVGKYDVSTHTKIPEIHITLEELAPQLSISQLADKSELFVNEEVMVHVIITATAESPVENISFSEGIPDSVTITNLKDMRYSNGILKWDTPLLSGERDLFYALELNHAANVTLIGNLTGSYPSGQKLSVAGNLVLKTIPASNPLTLAASISPQKSFPGDSVTYTATVANTENSENQVNSLVFSVSDPSIISWYDDKLQRAGPNFSWNGTVPANDTKEFTIRLLPEHTGSYNVSARLDNTFFDDHYKEYFTQSNVQVSNFQLSVAQLAPRISFMLDKTQVGPGDQSNIHVFVSNPNPKTPLYDIDAFVSTNLLGNHSIRLDSLAPGQEQEIFYMPFTAPSLIKDTYLNVALNGSYRTVYQEYFSFQSSKSLLIKGDPNYIAPPIEESNKTVIQNSSAIQGNKGIQNSSGTGNKPANPQPQGKGFFKQIIDWLVRLFGGK